MKNLEASINNVSKTTSGIINKIGKWALAIFSVRTAYGAIARSMSTLAQYDQGIKADLEYMSFAVAVGLKPIVEFIVNLAYKLLSLIRTIGIALFDFDIFSEATAKNFQKMSGNASKLKKTLTGFDEMNVLNSPTSGGASGGLGGMAQEIKVDEGLIEKLNGIKEIYLSMGDALNDPGMFVQAFGAWGMFIEGITRLVYSVFETIDGVMTLIKGLITGDTEKMKEGIMLIIEGLLNFILGVGQTIGGFIQGLLYELASGIVGLTNLVGEIWAEIVSTILFFIQQIVAGINKYLVQPTIKGFEKVGAVIGKAIADVIFGVQTKLKEVKEWMNTYVVQPIVGYFDGMWDAIGKDGFKGFINYIIQSFESAINWIGSKFVAMLNKISFKVPNWIPEVGGKKFGINIKYKNVELPRLAKGTILNNPGQGVLVGGSAIAGEAGREAYLPLSDTQLLEELGSTIGRYITINANITNTMNGRVISRELKRISASDNFAMNK